MTDKTAVQVIIDGKVLTIKGYESEEYIQKIATYINGKIGEYNKADSFRHAPKDVQQRLIEINIADDFFKAKAQNDALEAELKEKQEELYNMKHDVVNKDMLIESHKDSLKKAQEELHEYAKRIAVLETELKEAKKVK